MEVSMKCFKIVSNVKGKVIENNWEGQHNVTIEELEEIKDILTKYNIDYYIEYKEIIAK